ncbi:hypothetical protein C8T65DRAFT_747699 [Cerioporus squamosus]|nr:hypothetical protein C8T65DRAFT_747699 [Cerioporus squamosus]
MSNTHTQPLWNIVQPFGNGAGAAPGGAVPAAGGAALQPPPVPAAPNGGAVDGNSFMAMWLSDTQNISAVEPPALAITNDERNALWLAYQVQQRQITAMTHLLDEAFKTPHPHGGNHVLGARLINSIHERTRELMRVGNVKVKYTVRPGETAWWDLPDPPAGRTGARIEDDFYCPDWNAPINSPTNDEFVDAVVEIVLMDAVNVGHPIEHLRIPIKTAVKRYLLSLKTGRRFHITGKDEHKKSMDDRRARRSHMIREMRKAQVPLRKYLGYDQTVGLEAVVRTDYVNSEWSSTSEKEPEARKALRIAQNVDAGNLEVRPVLWHVDKLDHIFAVLRGIRAAGIPAPNKDPALAAILNPANDGADYSEEQKKMFLTIIQSTANVRRRRANQKDRFWGRGDERMRKRKDARLPAYQELINPSWAGASAKNMRIYQTAPTCPSHFTILTTPMPRELMTHEDRVRYARPGEV